MKIRKVSFIGLFILLIFTNFSFADFYPSRVSESSYDNAPALIIRFTDALDSDTKLDQYIQLSPALENGSKWITLDEGYSWTLPFVQPNTNYRVYFNDAPTSVSGTLLDFRPVERNNKRLTSRQWNVKTKPVVPSVSFAQSGNYLSGTDTSALPVTVVNITDAEMDIFRINDKDRDQFLSRTLYSGKVRLDTLTEINRFAELIHTSRYTFDLKPNQRSTVNLDVSLITDKFQSGIYVAVLRKPGIYEYRYDTQIFARSDIGLHARFYNRQTQVVANSIESGQPLAGVQLTYYWGGGNYRKLTQQQTEITDGLGMSELSGSKSPSLIVAEYNNQISFLRASSNQLDLSAYPNVPSRHVNYQAFMYGPRNLYRPGETVDINMLMRDFDGKRVSNMPISATLYDARGSKVERFTWRAKKQGYYSYQFKLDSNAATGNWRLRINQSKNQVQEYEFKVEEFLPERLTLEFFDGALEKYRYLKPREKNVPINAQYLYGAPAAGNRADAVVTVSPATDLFENWQDFSFGNPQLNIRQKTQKLDEIKLDSTGQGDLVIPNNWDNVKAPLKYRVTASVYEEGGRPVTRTQSLIEFPGSSGKLVGVRPQFNERPDSNDRVKFDLISVDFDGTEQEDQVSVELVRKTRDYYWYYDNSSGWNWRYDRETYVAFAQEISIPEDGAEIEIPLQWGDYELRLTSDSNQVTVYPFRTQYRWDDSTSNNLRSEVISIRLDKDFYAPGEDVDVIFHSAAAGEALVQIESSEGILTTEQIDVTSGENKLSLLIDPFWNRHDLYLSIMVLSPADQVNEVAPKRALGITHLPIRRDNAEFDVEIVAPEKSEPNRPVQAELIVNNIETSSGSRIWATMALVDMGVINITRYQRPQPESYFFAQRRFESQYLDLYGKIINNLGFQTYYQRFGGGFLMSDASLARGGEKAQSDVQIISFFSDPVEVIDGKANFSFDMPSFNGRVKWMAVVWSEETYGSEEAETTIADRLVTQLSMPRFLAMGDTSELTLDLHNLSGEPQEFKVDVAITGAIQTNFKNSVVTLNDKEKRSLKILIEAIDHQGSGEIALRVSNGQDIHVERQWNLSVRAPFPIQTNRSRWSIEANSEWQPDFDLSSLVLDTTNAQLTLSDKPAINFGDHFEYLLSYPYGCLEQTISSTYPWILIDQQTFDDLNLASAFEQRFNQSFSDEFRRSQIKAGITRLLKKQKSDGSFGYWNNNSQASLWGTSYATELLVDARNLGVNFDALRLQQALNQLNRLVKGNRTDNIWTEDDNYYQAAYRAYGAMVLAKAKFANLSDLRRLFEQMKSNPITQSGLPWMHMAVALKLTGDGAKADEAAIKALEIKRTGYGYYGDYGSGVRDTAQTLSLALEYDFEAGDLGLELENQLIDRRWLSTQERISLARLAKAYSGLGQNWQATLVTTKFEQNIDQNIPFNTLITGEQLASIQTIRAQDQRIYANILWNGVPALPPEPTSSGMWIKRQFYDLNGDPVNFDQPVLSGELFIARIDARSTEHRYPEALVVDLLPAGFELENQNLLNASVNLDEIIIDGENVGDHFRNYRIEHEEYRDDRYVAAVNLNSRSNTRLYYLVRAVTPGTYALPNSFVEDMYRPEFHALSHTPGSVTIMARP